MVAVQWHRLDAPYIVELLPVDRAKVGISFAVHFLHTLKTIGHSARNHRGRGTIIPTPRGTVKGSSCNWLLK